MKKATENHVTRTYERTMKAEKTSLRKYHRQHTHCSNYRYTETKVQKKNLLQHLISVRMRTLKTRRNFQYHDLMINQNAGSKDWNSQLCVTRAKTTKDLMGRQKSMQKPISISGTRLPAKNPIELLRLVRNDSCHSTQR